MRDLREAADAGRHRPQGQGRTRRSSDDILANTPEATRDPRKPWLLAPNDLQAIKAAGVTFPLSMLERVIEEQARGAPEKAEAIRSQRRGRSSAATSPSWCPAASRRPSSSAC